MAGLAGKVAVVTGGSRGIGRGIAERLAQEGASVVVNYAQGAEEARQVVAGIETRKGTAIAIQADMSRIPDVRRLFDENQKAFGQLDILVNNAGIFRQQAMTDVTEEEYDRLFAINTKGPFFAMQEAAKRMADGGRIVNISTFCTRVILDRIVAYGGTRAAVEFFTKAAAKELGSRKITVNTISPGYTDTGGLGHSGLGPVGTQASPLGRLGTPQDIADVVAFIVSDQGGWITGATIQAGGGVAI